MSGRKIPKEYENQIDNVLIDFSEYTLNPILYKLGFNANMITFMSFVTGIIAVYFAYNNCFILTGIFLLISYLLDCADGNFARKYNQTTKFGDIMDHVSDVIKYSLLIIVILRNKSIKSNSKVLFIAIIIIFIVPISIQFGCQETLYDKDESDSLYILKKFCNIENPETLIKYTRTFGSGTLHVIIFSILLYFAYTIRTSQSSLSMGGWKFFL